MSVPQLAASAQSDILRACRAIGAAIGNLGGNGPSAQVFVGWPTTTKIIEAILQQPGPVQVTIYPHAGRSTTRYHPTAYVSATPVPGTVASLNAGKTAITIAGAPVAGDVIHAFFGAESGGGYAYDAAYRVVAGDTYDSIATGLGASMNALDFGSAAVTGSMVGITAGTFGQVNVGASSILYREIGRQRRLVQVSIWAPTADDVSQASGALALREQVGQQILSSLGGSDRTFLVDELGRAVLVQYSHDRWDDGNQLSYSLFKWDIFFDVEHAITQTLPGTQVEGVTISTQVNNGTLATAHYGGPVQNS